LKTLDKIILTLYTFSLAVVAGMLMLAALHVIEPHIWLTEALDTTSGRISVGLVGTVFFGVSVRLIYTAIFGSRGGEAVLHTTELGEVRISLDAVENLVRRVARSVKGVREMKAAVTNGPEGLVVMLRGVISPDVSVPAATEEIQQSVKSYVHRVVGVEVVEVRIAVENISNEGRRRID
jgi:uncharacterized alkaline shock family protein YloU